MDRRSFVSGLALSPMAVGRQPTAMLDRLIGGNHAPPLIGAGVIARRASGQVAFAGAAGASVRGESLRPFELDSPFRVASVSKMVAAAGLMKLVDQGRLDLDQDVSGPLGFALRHPAWPAKVLTARMLLSHTSGLRNGPNYPVPLGNRVEDVLLSGTPAYADGAWWSPPDQVPGVFFAYADVNFVLVAQLIERMTGQRFDLYMRKVLLGPLGLDAGYNWSGVSQVARDRAASGCRWIEERWRTQVDDSLAPAPQIRVMPAPEYPDLTLADYRLGENGFVFSPQGGLRLSLNDMDRLAQLFAAKGRWRGRALVSEKALEAMIQPVWRFDAALANGLTDGGVLRAYGLGAEMSSDAAGIDGDQFFGANSEDWRGHLGDAYGWLTGLFWNVKDGSSLVWAVNGTPETGRAPGRRCALSRWEEDAIDIGLGALNA